LASIVTKIHSISATEEKLRKKIIYVYASQFCALKTRALDSPLHSLPGRLIIVHVFLYQKSSSANDVMFDLFFPAERTRIEVERLKKRRKSYICCKPRLLQVSTAASLLQSAAESTMMDEST